MTEPDLTTEIVGYRQWYVTSDLELRAAGYSFGGAWQRGVNTAKCGRVQLASFETAWQADPCGDCPGEACDCGFYALHDPSDHWYGKSTGMGAGLMAWSTATTDPLLSGIIVAWGKVQVHHQGFRAEHARIAALALPTSKRDQAVARAVARAYGVPCVPSEELPRVAAEYGGTVPVEFRPAKVKKPKNDLYSRLIGGYKFGGSQHYWTTTSWPAIQPIPAPPPPKVSKEARKRMDLIEGVKKASNRQGPIKPKRAPKKLR